MTAVLIGAVLFAAGIAVLVHALAPTPVRLDVAMAATQSSRRGLFDVDEDRALRSVRVGDWLNTRFGHTWFARLDPADLALLEWTPGQAMVRRLLGVLVGLVAPQLLTVMVLVTGLPGAAVPLLLGVVLATLLWFVPTWQVHAVAAAMRREFADDLTVYLEIFVLQRLSGSGLNQSIDQAARGGTTWPFQRIQDALARSRLAGTPGGDATALRALGQQIDSQPLVELGKLLESVDANGTAVAGALRIRADNAREAALVRLQVQAGQATTRMTVPYSMLGTVFILLIGYPAVVALLSINAGGG